MGFEKFLICSFSKNYGGFYQGYPIVFLYLKSMSEIEKAVCSESGEIDMAFSFFCLGEVNQEIPKPA